LFFSFSVSSLDGAEECAMVVQLSLASGVKSAKKVTTTKPFRVHFSDKITMTAP
jgi:hypothetical protein